MSEAHMIFSPAQMIAEAKAHRDANGIVDPKLDAQYARMLSGDMRGLVGQESNQKAGSNIAGIREGGVAKHGELAYIGERPGRGGNGMISTTPRPMRNAATPKMINYIHVLLGQRQHNYGPDHLIHAALSDGMSFDMARKTIEFLKAQPYKLASQRGESVPSAPVQPVAPKRSAWQEWNELAAPLLSYERFATTGKDGQTKFWRVFEYERQSDGRKFTIMRAVSGAAEGGHWAERLSPEFMISVAQEIHAAGIQESAKRYGQESGRCSDCNRLLTDKVSVDRGVGPVCITKPHWS